MDPIVRGMIADVVLKSLKASGWGAGEEIDAAIRALSVVNERTANWIDPADTDSEEIRPQVQAALNKLRALPAAKEKVLRQKAAMLEALPFGFSEQPGAVFRLDRVRPQEWQVMSSGPLREGATLWALQGDAAKKTLVRFGEVKGGKVVFLREPPVPEGSMIFFCKGK